MNALDKIKNVQNGLNCCVSYYCICEACPYQERTECKRELSRDADEVINALRAELKKRTKNKVEDKPRFIMLTQWSSTKALQKRVAIKIDDILYVSDLSNSEHCGSNLSNSEHCGSNIKLKGEDGFTIVVAESIEEILLKISGSKGEEE